MYHPTGQRRFPRLTAPGASASDPLTWTQCSRERESPRSRQVLEIPRPLADSTHPCLPKRSNLTALWGLSKRARAIYWSLARPGAGLGKVLPGILRRTPLPTPTDSRTVTSRHLLPDRAPESGRMPRVPDIPSSAWHLKAPRCPLVLPPFTDRCGDAVGF